MGRRKISLEPAARLAGSEGLTEIEVSLWGPHSFETSMLAAVGDVPAEACLSTPPCRSAWYLVHQVGLSEVFVCAKRKVALRHISVRDLIICILRENTSILLKGVRRAQAGPAGLSRQSRNVPFPAK